MSRGAAALVFELRVTDGQSASATDSVTVNVSSENLPPVADAGPDQQAEEGETVTLDGRDSSDPESSEMSCQWLQEGGGPGVTLSDPASWTPTFVAPAVEGTETPLTFRLTVEDEQGLQGSDWVTVVAGENGITGFPAGMITFPTTTGKPLGISSGSGANLVALWSVAPASLGNRRGLPAELPYGVLDVRLRTATPGGAAIVTVFLPAEAAGDDEWFWYTDVQGWVSFAGQALFDGRGKWVALTLTDGGKGDEDGVADGRIHHRSALGMPVDAERPPIFGGGEGDGGGACFLRALGW